MRVSHTHTLSHEIITLTKGVNSLTETESAKSHAPNPPRKECPGHDSYTSKLQN